MQFRRQRPYEPARPLTPEAVDTTIAHLRTGVQELDHQAFLYMQAHDGATYNQLGWWAHRFVPFEQHDNEWFQRGIRTFIHGARIGYMAFRAANPAPQRLCWFLEADADKSALVARRKFGSINGLADEDLRAHFLASIEDDQHWTELAIQADQYYPFLSQGHEFSWPPHLRNRGAGYLHLGIGSVAFLASFSRQMSGGSPSAN
jgi:hypothetical protein